MSGSGASGRRGRLPAQSEAVSSGVTRKTQILDDVDEAAALLRAGGLVAFPTETVYGLGADARNVAAVEGIFRAKGRPQDNPLIVHVADAAAVAQVTGAAPPSAERLLAAFAPGPITVVVPRGEALAAAVSAGLDTVAVRIPAHPTALALLRAAAIPVAAPSANRSGRPSATRWEAVREELDGRVDAILRGERSEVGIESTVVDCTADPPEILRPGGLSLEKLRTVIPDIRSAGKNHRASPGTRHRHYAPGARVLCVERPQPEATAAYLGLEAPAPGYALERVVPDLETYARELYDFFRTADAAGCREIHCLVPPDEGLGRALRDRLTRAAEASGAGD